MCGPLSEILRGVRRALCRGRRIEGKLNELLVLANKEIAMTDAVTARLEQLEVQVNARTTQLGQMLAAAKAELHDAEAKGRAAQKKEDEEAAAADKAAALAKIEDIANSLVAFTASGN